MYPPIFWLCFVHTLEFVCLNHMCARKPVRASLMHWLHSMTIVVLKYKFCYTCIIITCWLIVYIIKHWLNPKKPGSHVNKNNNNLIPHQRKSSVSPLQKPVTQSRVRRLLLRRVLWNTQIHNVGILQGISMLNHVAQIGTVAHGRVNLGCFDFLTHF
jgi:hypothetical protein